MVLSLPCLPHIEAEAEALQYCAPWRVMASYRKSHARRMNASRIAYRVSCRVWWSHDRRERCDGGFGPLEACRRPALDKSERTSTLTTSPDIPSGSIFSNAAAREYGFTDGFWVEVCGLYEKALAADSRRSLAVLDRERTVRRSFRGQPVDVLVRNHPDAREFQQLRFTAFLADPNEDAPEIPRWYMDHADRRVLGEAVLPDYPNDW